MEAWIGKAGSHSGSVPVAIGEEAERQVARAKALLRPAAWGVASSARATISTLLLHLPAFEIRGADDGVIEAWWKTWETALADVPLDLLQDAAKTCLSMTPAFDKMPTPAQFREILIKRKYLYLRKNRLLVLEKLAGCPRKDPAPVGRYVTPEDISAALAKMRAKFNSEREPAPTDDPDLEDLR